VSRERRALVTGGAGFVGGHLCEGLLAAGWRVRVLDDLSTGREENLESVRDRIELEKGDVRDPETVARAVEDVEVVFHEAAVPSVSRSVADPLGTHAVNASGTLALLEGARRGGVRRVVYAASSSAYGDTRVLPKTESMPANPRSPYALQKYTGEVYCRLYTELYGLETVSLRYFNIFGPRQDPRSQYAAVIPRFITSALRGEPPQIHGDGRQTRDFTFVADAVHANLCAADAPGAVGRVVNVAAGRRTSLLELWSAIRRITGATVEPRFTSPRPGDVRDSLADLDRAQTLLGYAPQVSLTEGLRRTVEHFRGQTKGSGR